MSSWKYSNPVFDGDNSTYCLFLIAKSIIFLKALSKSILWYVTNFFFPVHLKVLWSDKLNRDGQII